MGTRARIRAVRRKAAALVLSHRDPQEQIRLIHDLHMAGIFNTARAKEVLLKAEAGKATTDLAVP